MSKSIADALREIDDAKWIKDEYGCLNLKVTNWQDQNVYVQLELRRSNCDRGHLMMKIDGIIDIDNQDNFPRYFFSFKEADAHTRTFLKWRLYKYRVHPHVLEIE